MDLGDKNHILVQSRTKLINHVRGLVKSTGERLPSCSSESFVRRCEALVPTELWPALKSVFNVIGRLTDQIKDLDGQIDKLCQDRYPETGQLQQVSGIGPVIALCYVLTIEDPGRFKKSRQLGAFLGLTPRRDQSGSVDKQLHITKTGNKYLRQLLVNSAHYILGRFGPDSDLRRHGLRIAVRGGKNAKKRAAVAVARKLAVVLHQLWQSGQTYDPLYNRSFKKAA
jgi:transposase